MYSTFGRVAAISLRMSFGDEVGLIVSTLHWPILVLILIIIVFNGITERSLNIFYWEVMI